MVQVKINEDNIFKIAAMGYENFPVSAVFCRVTQNKLFIVTFLLLCHGTVYAEFSLSMSLCGANVLSYCLDFVPSRCLK